jgi:hypothetical protein
MMKKSPKKVLLIVLIVFVSLLAISLGMSLPLRLSERKAQREAAALEALNRELESTFKQSLLEGKNVSGFSPKGGKAVAYNLDENHFSTFHVSLGREVKTINEIDEVGFIIKFERGADEDANPNRYYRDRESGRSFDMVYATWRVSVLETAHFAVIGDLSLRSTSTHRTDIPEEEVIRSSVFPMNPIEEIIAAYLKGAGKE